jgi:hypothetical protein
MDELGTKMAHGESSRHRDQPKSSVAVQATQSQEQQTPNSRFALFAPTEHSVKVELHSSSGDRSESN